jgi:hypothetical protein
MPRFLPRSIQDYAIPRREPTDFTHAAPTLLDDIGRKMSVDKARSEGRIPSPFSRSFVFYLNFHGKGLRAEGAPGDDAPQLDRGRELLQEEARRTFRGICAAFALRKVLGLDIRQAAVTLNPGGKRLEQVLVAAMDSAPRGKDHWNPLRFYTIQNAPGDRPEVLAGLSPLTAIAPAARPPQRLTSLFWYDPGDGTPERPARWYDPGSAELSEDGTFRLPNPLTGRTLRRLLRAWLTKACESTAVPTALASFGLTPGDGKLLYNELRRWLGELGGELREDGLVESEAIPGDTRDESPAFLEYACQPTDRELFGELLGDLPSFRGRLLVTREQLLDPGVRIYGRTFGRASLADAVERLPRQGDNLGADLGLGVQQVPIGYLFVDQLFATRLTLVTERGFSDQWKGLVIDDEHYLLPFRPEILDLLSPQELLDGTRGQRDRQGENYIITLRFGSVEIPQLYSISGQGEYAVDAETIPPEHLDIRLFPNFDLDSVGATPESNPLPPEERKYYARVRVSPLWTFRIAPFRYDAARRTVDTEMARPVRLGPAQSSGDPKLYHPGQVLIYTLGEKPSGFYVEERGLCLVQLPVARGARATWEVGVDFGTSNTCVTWRAEADGAPQILRLPVLTSTLLSEPGYSAEFDGPQETTVSEGAASLLDFFFKQQNTDEQLTTNDYFPTQVMTRHTEVRQKWDWDYEGGLIYFKNVSLANPIVWELIEGFPVPTWAGPQFHGKSFRVKQDVKWEQTSWLKVFMRHLRKQVLLAAARERGTVKRLHFSYPKAFSFTQKEEFFEALHEVWNPTRQPDVLVTVSESEAVRNYIVREANEYVVFDVGGGTTDLIGFSTHEPIFQTSFRLAAGHVNRYVVGSPAFRTAFLQAFREKVPDAQLPQVLEEKFGNPESGASPALLTTIWLGLLELIEQNDTNGRKVLEILGVLRRTQGDIAEPGVRAIRGFFLSLSLLFGGLSYYAGMLVRAASEGKFDGKPFGRRFVDLVLTGNGGKLYNMLDHPDAPFTPVMQGMFLSGMAAPDESPPTAFTADDLTHVGFGGLFRLNGRVAPKVTVALGLLQPPAGGENKQDEPIPLANILGEDGYTVDGQPVGFDTDLVSFYKDVQPRLRGFNPPGTPPRQFTRCLEALNRLLPNGMNRGMPVIPRAGTDWHRALLERLYQKSAKHIRTRISENATVLATDLRNNRIAEAEVPAQEPLFIVELAALLDSVREEYA